MPVAAWGRRALILTLALCLSAGGCGFLHNRREHDHSDRAFYAEVAATTISTPLHDHECDDAYALVAGTAPPRTLEMQAPIEYWDLPLQEAIHVALSNSKVLRSLGGAMLRAPDSVTTIQSPALQETDPRFGVEAALSAFDASWATRVFFEKNDRALNNLFFGGGTRLLQQDLIAYTSELTKRSAVGTQFTARQRIDYDYNNAPGNAVPNLPWTTMFETEIRHPLLQGGGVDFNRIAGPRALPGFYNGVLIARINTDISLADFEAGLVDMVSDVETAYWELYFAYRYLDGRIAARDRALETWRRVKSFALTGRSAGEGSAEARAREQYFRLEGEVQNALSGRLQERSRATTFRGIGGVYYHERQLRLLMGLPINDCRIIRPLTEPTTAQVRFCWPEILSESLVRRVELRRQQWRLKRRELELIAARNYLLPQLDVLGRYRWRGLGHDLLDPNRNENFRFDNAFQNLTSGDFQEWQLGAEFLMPIGGRQGHAAVRNAELNIHREVAVLHEQQREVALELSHAVAEQDRAFVLARTSLNRLFAAQQEIDAMEARYLAADEIQRARLLDLLLDAQRRLVDADSDYQRSLVEYMMSIKQLHFAKGSLLDYNGVYLTEGPWPDAAYHDAGGRIARRIYLDALDDKIHRTPVVSEGPYPQHVEPHEEPVVVPWPTPLN